MVPMGWARENRSSRDQLEPVEREPVERESAGPMQNHPRRKH